MIAMVFGRIAPPGSFLWLTRHEIRLAMRGIQKHSAMRYFGYVLLALYFAAGCVAGAALQNVEIAPWPIALTGVLAVAILMTSFMTTQAVLHSQRALYETGDLDLLFSAPVDGHVILRAKLAGIAGAIMLSFAVLILPFALPVAAMGHPGLFGIPLLLVALAMLSACLGLTITLVLARIAGPRAARTVGQIVAALLAGALFLASQLAPRDHRGGRFEAVFESLERGGFGSTGLSALPGRAAFGDPIALFILVGAAALCFWIAGGVLERLFLHGYQDGGVRLSRARASGRPVARHFRKSLFGTVVAKEYTLLARDPALTFQMLLRLIYLAPLLLAFTHGGLDVLAPGIAFASVAIAGQLVGSLAWLTVSAEDTPDLITVAPVAPGEIGRAKLAAALVMAGPVIVMVPIALAFWTLPGAAVTLVMTGVAGTLAGLIELKLGKPAQRKQFRQKRAGSVIAGLLSMLVTMLFGGAAAVAVYFTV